MTPDTPRRFRPRVRAAAGLGLALAGVAAFAGCAAAGSSAGAAASGAQSSAETRQESVQAVIDANADQTVVADDEWSAADAQDVELSGAGARSDAGGVSADDGTVTITEAGVYRLTGELDGSVAVDAGEEAQVVLILDGVTISAEGAPAISSVSADDVAIFLADGSENTVSSTGTYDEDSEANAAVFADNDLTISGTGSLDVDGSANDAITSKDDLVVLAGTISVTAADDGLRGKDSLTVRGGDITVDAGGDGVTSDQDDDETKGWVMVAGGALDITAGSDGVDGFTDAIITDGTVTISAEEGIEAGTVGITGGTIEIASTDDGINGSAGSADGTTENTASGAGAEGEGAGGTAPEGVEPPADGEMPEPPADGEAPGDAMPADGEAPTGGGMAGGGAGGMADTGEWILIEGGDITIDAAGDGLDSNGSVDVSGGTVVVFGPTNAGNGALDANGEITTTGGTLVALDSGGMSETPSADSEQAWLAASVGGQEGQEIAVTDAEGAVIWRGNAGKAFGALVVSTPDVAAGGTYAVAVDGEESATAAAGEALAGGMGGPRG